MRQKIISQLDELNKAGTTDAKIAEVAGFNRSLISLIRKPETDPKRQKAIKPEQYRVIMSL